MLNGHPQSCFQHKVSREPKELCIPDIRNDREEERGTGSQSLLQGWGLRKTALCLWERILEGSAHPILLPPGAVYLYQVPWALWAMLQWVPFSCEVMGFLPRTHSRKEHTPKGHSPGNSEVNCLPHSISLCWQLRSFPLFMFTVIYLYSNMVILYLFAARVSGTGKQHKIPHRVILCGTSLCGGSSAP